MSRTIGHPGTNRVIDPARAMAVALALAGLAVACSVVLRPLLPRWTLGAEAWWPAAGIVTAVLARAPRRWWLPALTAAAVTSLADDLLAGVAPWRAAILAVANLAEVLVAAYTLTGRRSDRPVGSVSVASQLRVIAAIGLGLAASAAVAGPYFALAETPAWPHLRGYLLAHSLVLTAFAPLLLLADRADVRRHLTDRAGGIEWVVQLACSIVLADLIFVNGHAGAYGFLLFVPLLWGASRLGPLRSMLTVLVSFALALAGARAARGTAGPNLSDPDVTRLFCLLITIAVAVLLMLMAAQRQHQAIERLRSGQALLRESEERFRLSFGSASVGMYIATLDPERHMRITDVNDALCEFLGRPAEQILGRRPEAFSDEAREAEDEARRLTRDGGDLSRWRREIRFTRADGTPVDGLVSCSVVHSDVEAPYVVAQVVDITARKRAEDRLRHLATHDPLTGLPNRALLAERIETALGADGLVGLLFCDLDGFKQVNDSAGHSAGDELLEQAAARLRGVVRPGDSVARLGGDEFAVLCAGLTGEPALETIAGRVLDALREPFALRAGTFTVSASIGASVSGPTVNTPDRLLHQADVAMYSAKRAGKDRVVVSGEDERNRARRESWLRPALETALRDGELVMFGQPIVDLATGAICGVETLLRWRHRELGTLAPGAFLDVAENSPLILPIGRRALRESCRLAAQWCAQLGPLAPDVHVNVSGRQLASGTFADDVLDALRSSGTAPERLVLELTETHMPLMADSLRADIVRLREAGIRFALDDIGTGYSSLARLTELPVDVLKIDMKFVAGLGTNPSCDAVVRAVLAIGRALGGDVIAEGVETAEQERQLRDYGCRFVQGFLLARPQPEPALALTLAAAAAGRQPMAELIGR